jgi:branched-subunit amino acid aminotransferase/4-amino-4-deoxychorismate lyase
MSDVEVGVFETMRVRRGGIPLLERHLARLARSLAALGLPARVKGKGGRAPARELDTLVAPFVEMGEAVLRLEVRDGQSAVTVRDVPESVAPAVFTASARHVPYPHKTTERACFEAAAAEADRAKADDALLLTREGWVAEGTVWSVFWWDGESLRTPALELGVLPGIARARLGELARLEEGRWARGALDGKSLVLANAVRGVVPVARLDGVPVPVDIRTAEIARSFWPD